MLTYADLSGISIVEGKIPNLQKLQENFYLEFKEIFKNADEKHEEYLRAIFEEIYSLRLKKIFMHALRQIVDIDVVDINKISKPENILKDEEEIYYKFLEIIKEKKEEILCKNPKTFAVFGSSLEDKETEKGRNKEKEKEENKKSEEEFKKIKIKFLKECPAIVGIDLKRYGPFKENDIALIIDAQAKILVENKFAEVVNE